MSKRAAKKAKKAKHKTDLTRSTRHVLPLERQRWSAVHQPDGTITVGAVLWCPDYQGRFLVCLNVWDADDTGWNRWTEYPTSEDAQEGYRRAVEEVSKAPNPLPFAWVQGKGLHGG